MTDTDHPSPAHRFLIFLIVAFAASGVAGLFWESHVQPGYRAVRAHDDGLLSTLVLTENRKLTERFGFAATVHDAARGGTVVVPADDVVDRFLLENLAQVDVVVTPYDPVLGYDPTDVVRENTTLRGIGVVAPTDDTMPWLVVWSDDSETSRTLRYFTRGTNTFLIDDRLAGALVP